MIQVVSTQSRKAYVVVQTARGQASQESIGWQPKICVILHSCTLGSFTARKSIWSISSRVVKARGQSLKDMKVQQCKRWICTPWLWQRHVWQKKSVLRRKHVRQKKLPKKVAGRGLGYFGSGSSKLELQRFVWPSVAMSLSFIKLFHQPFVGVFNQDLKRKTSINYSCTKNSWSTHLWQEDTLLYTMLMPFEVWRCQRYSWTQIALHVCRKESANLS